MQKAALRVVCPATQAIPRRKCGQVGAWMIFGISSEGGGCGAGCGLR